MKRGELVLLCEARWHPALSVRMHTRPNSWSLLRMPVNVAPDAMVRDWLRTRAGTSARIIVNLCNISSVASAFLSTELKRRGVDYLDAPLTGNLQDGKQGKLTVIVSGPKAAFALAKPLLEVIGNRVFYMGKQPGAAQLMQQINGSLASTLLAVACEIYITGVKAGLTPNAMTQIFSNGSGRNAASAEIVPRQVATRRFSHGKRIADAYQELTLMNQEADRRGVTMWVGGKTRQLYGLARQLGEPDDDITRLVTHYENWAKVKVQVAGRSPRRK